MAESNPMPSESVQIPEVVPSCTTIVQKKVEPPVRAKKERVLHTLLDAKLEDMDLLKDNAKNMDLDKWSKIVARLDTERNVKVDATVTALGILALFPVAQQELEA